MTKAELLARVEELEREIQHLKAQQHNQTHLHYHFEKTKDTTQTWPVTYYPYVWGTTTGSDFTSSFDIGRLS